MATTVTAAATTAAAAAATATAAAATATATAAATAASADYIFITDILLGKKGRGGKIVSLFLFHLVFSYVFLSRTNLFLPSNIAHVLLNCKAFSDRP